MKKEYIVSPYRDVSLFFKINNFEEFQGFYSCRCWRNTETAIAVEWDNTNSEMNEANWAWRAQPWKGMLGTWYPSQFSWWHGWTSSKSTHYIPWDGEIHKRVSFEKSRADKIKEENANFVNKALAEKRRNENTKSSVMGGMRGGTHGRGRGKGKL